MLRPNSGFAPFAASVGTAVVSRSRASPSCCAFNDEDDKQENSRVQDKNRTNLSFMRTPAYHGYDFFGKTNDCANKKQQPYHNSLTINDKSRAESRLSTPKTTTAAKGMDWSG
jgi:hypothetical protein